MGIVTFRRTRSDARSPSKRVCYPHRQKLRGPQNASHEMGTANGAMYDECGNSTEPGSGVGDGSNETPLLRAV